MKYIISWSEDDFKPCWTSSSLIKTFCEVYGVRNFIIKCKKFNIFGSHFIILDNYDLSFHYMVSCFLTKKQVNKLYRYLCK